MNAIRQSVRGWFGVAAIAATTAALVIGTGRAHAQGLAVTTTSPAINAINVASNTPVVVSFDRAVDPTTFTDANFRVFGKLTGPLAPVGGMPVFSNGNQTVTFTPTRTLAANETVLVIMSHGLRAADGTFLRSAGYSFTYCTRAAVGPGRFREIASVSNRDATGAQTRIYGGLACDLNRDGWCDLTTVNEVSADLRVFLNRADGSGQFGPMLTPYTSIPYESSPNEVGDFDRDGFIDAVFSSYDTRIALCFGNGNGTFRTPQVITVGTQPRGFGILDVDGDGDMDIAVGNTLSNDVSLLINNGAGVFAAPVSIPMLAGDIGPYGLSAADMNNDGILDLVVGCRDSRTVAVFRCNGNATFTRTSTRNIGGFNWVLAVGDLNNDGRMDVSAANSGSANGSILMGNGDGTLQAAVVTNTGGHTVSTDLADIDGDGDLDWILSSYGAGLWYVYVNDGAGHFSPLTQVVAPANPSCAVPMDVDNDGDVDLVLTDEIADRIVIMLNVCPSDFNAAGGITVQDIFDFLGAWFAGDPRANFNSTGGLTVQDIFDFLGAWFAGC